MSETKRRPKGLSAFVEASGHHQDDAAGRPGPGASPCSEIFSWPTDFLAVHGQKKNLQRKLDARSFFTATPTGTPHNGRPRGVRLCLSLLAMRATGAAITTGTAVAAGPSTIVDLYMDTLGTYQVRRRCRQGSRGHTTRGY